MKIGLVQLASSGRVEANLAQAEASIEQAAGQGAQVVALPEVLHLRVSHAEVGRYREHAEPIPGPMTERIGALAKRLGVSVLLGSVGEASDESEKTYNTSVLIGVDGAVVASYRKVHLFDVEVDAANRDRESDRVLPGGAVVTAEVGDARVGLTICYDLRFPELYRSLALAGARMIFVPADFTRTTGEAHWLTLLRARAIENGLFIVAPAQCGAVPGRYEAYGHSAVIDPWGSVLCEMADTPGVAVVDVDMGEVDRVRQRIPALKHRRPEVYRLERV